MLKSESVRRSLAVLCMGVATLLMGMQPAHATAGINNQINYQARLLTLAGATVADGTYNLEFKIYSGGNGCVGGGTSPCSGTLLWTEDWLNNNTQGVTVTNGYFSVMLGAGSDSVGLSTLNFNQTPLWLSVNIGNTNGTCTPFSSCSGDTEMLPFTQFAAAPYAFDASQVGGLSATNFVQLAQGLQTDSSTTSPSIDVSKTIGSDVTVNGIDFTITDNNSSAATGTIYGLNVNNADNGANTGNVKAIARFLNSQATDTLPDGVLIQNNPSSGTLTNGLRVLQNTAGGTTTNGIQIQDAAGTLTNGLLFSGTIGTDIAAAAARGLTVTGNANSTFSTSTGALTITSAAGATWSTNAGTLTLQAGGGTVSLGTSTILNSTNGLTVTGGSTLALNSTTSSNISLDSGTTGSILIGGDTTDAKTVSIGPTATNAGTTVYNFGTNTAGTQTFNIGSTNSGTIANSGTTVSIQGGTAANAISIGTTAAVNQVTIGSSNGGSNTTIQGGTGNINLLTNNSAAGVIDKTSTNSATAFQIQNSSSASILTVNTAGGNAGNLVANPSFETTISGSGAGVWVIKQGGAGVPTIANNTSQFFNQLNSAKVVTTANAGDGIKQQLNTTLTGNTAYNVIFYSKLDAASIAMNGDLQAGYSSTGASDDTACALSQTTIVTGWTKYSCTFNTPASPTSSNYFYIKQTDGTSAHTFYVDAVLLQLSSTADANYRDAQLSVNGIFNSPILIQNNSNSTNALTVQNAAGGQVFNVDTTDTNLINNPANPSFEVNTAGWAVRFGGGTTTATINRDTSQQKYGLASLKITSAAQSGDGARYTLASGNWATGNTTVSFSMLNQGTAFAAVPIVLFGNGSDNACAAVTPSTIPSTSGWIQYTAVCNFSGSTNSIVIAQNEATTHTFYIDAVQVETGSVATVYGLGAISISGQIITPTTFKNQSNSAAAFQVQNTNGDALINLDTNNAILNLGETGSVATASTVNVANTSGNATQTVNIGATNAAGNTVLIQGGTGTAVSLQGATNGTIAVGTVNANTVALGSTGSGNAVAGTLINIQGGTTAATAVTIGTNGAGGITMDTGTTGSILIGGGTTGNPAKTISLGPIATNSSTTIYNLGVNTAGTQTIKIGSSADGSAAAGTTVDIQGGTTASTAVIIGTNGAGGITMDTGTTGSILIGGGTTGNPAKTISIGPTATNTSTTTYNLGVNTAGTQLVRLGSTGSGNAIAGTLINIQGGTTANTAVTIGTNGAGGITIDSGTSGNIKIGAGANAKTVTVGNATGASIVNLLGGLAGAATGGVTIGTADGNQTNLVLDNSQVFADAGTCSNTVNLGAMYYNDLNFNSAAASATGSIRVCEGIANTGTTDTAGWSDLASTADLGAVLFGVVPDSGNSTNAQDLTALITAGKTGPCKVSAASATTVNIEPCVAYTGGRRIIVNQQTAFAVTVTSGWTSICLDTASTDAPANHNGTTELNSLPTFSLTAPVLCLASIKVSGTAITQVYDTRAFTTSAKEFVTTGTAVGLGYIAAVSGAAVAPLGTGTVGTVGSIRGVVVGTNGGTSATTSNAIIVTAGPAFAKVTDAGATAGQFVENSAGTAGYGTSSATGSATLYGNLGFARNTSVATATCTTTPNAANCIGSTYVDVVPR